MISSITSPVVSTTGKTRLQASLERATARQGPSIGQWLEFPGYSLARTVAHLGADVRAASLTLYFFCYSSDILVVGIA